MNRRILEVCAIPALAALFFFVVAPCASAQEANPGASIDIFGGRVESIESSDGHSNSYGVRGGYRFGRVWALEGSGEHLNEGFTNWFVDLSAKAYFVHANRFEIYGLVGPGVLRVSAFGQSSDQAMVHAGLGAQIGLGDRVYLRPEVRGRWSTDDVKFNDGLVSYSLGLGWRF
ncbi:MAG TPA: outer membrane beta-barrel protein [Thermoanaerobaculia bacterium]|nr:outer membrane beta-barrel protein [Thermoanaerobaculia bacterium]